MLLHRSIVWVKNWSNRIDLPPFVCSIPIYGKEPEVGEEEKCGKKQNSIPENGDSLTHPLPPLHVRLVFLKVLSLSAYLQERIKGLPQALNYSHIPQPTFHPCAHISSSGAIPKNVLMLVLSEKLMCSQLNCQNNPLALNTIRHFGACFNAKSPYA